MKYLLLLIVLLSFCSCMNEYKVKFVNSDITAVVLSERKYSKNDTVLIKNYTNHNVLYILETISNDSTNYKKAVIKEVQ